MKELKIISEEEKMALFFLISVPGIGNVTITKLLKHFRSASEALMAEETELRTILKERQAEAFLGLRKQFQVEKEYEAMQKKGILFLTMQEQTYPQRLREIPDPPCGIFCMGGLPKDERLSVAVIGARECSEYGKYVAVELGKSLAECGIDLISGMARGIDGISQNAAVANGGRSYAVLGSGVDVCYPESNRRLYERLKTTGGIVSPYPPGTLAKAQNFPPRNRIVSGLADVLVVIEGKVNSGTLITVDMALEQGKEVYVVPGRITDRLSDGCNRLIKQGAGVFLSPDSFIDEILGGFIGKKSCAANELSDGKKLQKEGRIEIFETGNHKIMLTQLTQNEREVLEALDYTPQSMDVILNKMREEGKELRMEQVMVILMNLALKGIVIQKSQGQFAISGKESFSGEEMILKNEKDENEKYEN